MGPSSGYDLKRGFDHALIPFFGAVYSQIYHELNRLHKLGWAEMEMETSSQRPARKRYTITQAGREALAAWHNQPLEKPQLRDELFLRTIFGHAAPPEALLTSFRNAIADHEQRLAFTQEEVRTHGDPLTGRPSEKGRDSDYDRYIGLVIQFERRFEEMYLGWLRESLAFLESGANQNPAPAEGHATAREEPREAPAPVDR
ncbi:PadR family transcriptional regulator [Ktedonosporobacter rubrisoli]|uniref:PadR family transcriptional regulator n=1 Tax=Ktedonosporobacter rubrisoli TaxID=2509675 RepID=A0A4P6JVZ2_KTERU|nr:PadR family transcriptional regulator [Ktedonosporobacter rubrisoli]QBD79530.1 PadR family transcriptional regulator [Ktedonosporobacter rubrisoli]